MTKFIKYIHLKPTQEDKLKKRLPYTKSHLLLLVLTLLGALLLSNCSNSSAEKPWVLDCKEDTPESCGYVNQQSEVMIDYGKYPMYFTDTFDTYAIVIKEGEGMVAINRAEEVLYQVFVYDNGPDYASDGYFRIMKDQKIGYADVQTGAITVKPAFAVARPFENQYAPVCPDCEVTQDGSHSLIGDGKWGLIDKTGKMVIDPTFDDIREIAKEGKALVVSGGTEKWIDIQ